MQQSLDNTKIDVAAYAKQYGITLEQSHNEIQPWLFEHGYSWTCQEVRLVAGDFIFLYYDKRITEDCDEEHFRRHSNKEIFLERNIVLTIKQEPDVIEIDGKKYNKEDVMKAIQQFEIV